MLVTHDQEEAFSMADRIGVMDRGRLQEVGEPRALYERPATRFVAKFLGAANLLLGAYGYRDVQIGESYFEVGRWSRSLRSGDEAAVIVRPEDVTVAASRDDLLVPPVGTAKVVEMQFVGAIERLRLEMQATPTLTSAPARMRRRSKSRFRAPRARRRHCRSRLARKSLSGSSACTRCRRRSAAFG